VELRDILQIAGAIVTVISSLAVSRHQVSKHETTIEQHSAKIAQIETQVALLDQGQTNHAAQIDALVRDLREAVSNLQRIALDLARLSGK